LLPNASLRTIGVTFVILPMSSKSTDGSCTCAADSLPS
jgi:hypothetical protein